MSNSELRKRWEERVAAFKASGQSTADWSATNNLKISQLRYWLRKFKSGETMASSTKWVSLELDDRPKVENSSVTIRIDQIVIEVKPGFNPSLLTEVIRTLKGLC